MNVLTISLALINRCDWPDSRMFCLWVARFLTIPFYFEKGPWSGTFKEADTVLPHTLTNMASVASLLQHIMILSRLFCHSFHSYWEGPENIKGNLRQKLFVITAIKSKSTILIVFSAVHSFKQCQLILSFSQVLDKYSSTGSIKVARGSLLTYFAIIFLSSWTATSCCHNCREEESYASHRVWTLIPFAWVCATSRFLDLTSGFLTLILSAISHKFFLTRIEGADNSPLCSNHNTCIILLSSLKLLSIWTQIFHPTCNRHLCNVVTPVFQLCYNLLDRLKLAVYYFSTSYCTHIGLDLKSVSSY